jgi:hypothetical protein
MPETQASTKVMHFTRLLALAGTTFFGFFSRRASSFWHQSTITLSATSPYLLHGRTSWGPSWPVSVSYAAELCIEFWPEKPIVTEQGDPRLIPWLAESSV